MFILATSKAAFLYYFCKLFTKRPSNKNTNRARVVNGCWEKKKKLCFEGRLLLKEIYPALHYLPC